MSPRISQGNGFTTGLRRLISPMVPQIPCPSKTNDNFKLSSPMDVCSTEERETILTLNSPVSISAQMTVFAAESATHMKETPAALIETCISPNQASAIPHTTGIIANCHRSEGHGGCGQIDMPRLASRRNEGKK